MGTNREDTPFAQLLRHYMWRVRMPPINANKLANELHVSRTTVSNWLAGTKPSPEMVPMLAAKLGVPATELSQLLGYPVFSDRNEVERVFAYIIDSVERYKDFSPNERARIIEHMRELQAQYEAGLAPDHDPDTTVPLGK